MVKLKKVIDKIFDYNNIIHKILLYSLAFTMVYVFLKINITTAKKVTIDINSIGEAKFEAFLILLFLKTCIIKIFEQGYKPLKEKLKNE